MSKLAEIDLPTEIGKTQICIQALRCLQLEHGTDWREGDGRMLAHVADLAVGQLECCISRSQRLSIMELASATRNLFELIFISDYLSRSAENRLCFVNEVEADTRYIKAQMGKTYYSRIGDAEHRSVISRLRARDTATEPLGRINNGSRPASKIAAELGREDDFQKFNRLYSKLCHPTPWAILGRIDAQVGWERYAVFLLTRANCHAVECLEHLLAGLPRKHSEGDVS